MKILSTKRLLIICLTLVFAVATGLFATLCYRNAYAAVSPNEIVVYDGEEDGSEGGEEEDGDSGSNVPGDGEIAPPQPGDDNDFNPDSIVEIIVEVGKLKLRVTGWKTPVTPASEAVFNTNPYGEYSPELVDKIDALIKSKTFISYSIWDTNGNPVTDTTTLPAGSTYFIHIDVNEKYKDSVEIEFDEGVQRSLAGQIGFPSTEKLEPFPKFEQTVFEYQFDGTPVDIKAKFLNDLMAGKEDFLIIVESESDDYVQNGAGEFHYRIAFKTSAKYYWEGTNNDRSAVDIIVKVSPMTLSTDVDFGEIYYTGLQIDISGQIEELFKGYVIGQKVSVLAPNSGTTGENVGEYDVKLVIKDEYASSVKWEGVTENFIIVKWNILQTTIAGEWDSYGQYGIMTIVSDIYKGGDAKAIKYTYTDLDSGETVTKLEKGHHYRVDVELINDNLKFTDDTLLSYEFTLESELTTFEKPVIEVSEQEYDGTDLSFKVTVEGVDVTDVKFADYIEIVEDESDSLTQKNAGEYTVVIRLKEGAFWTIPDVSGYFKDDVRLTFKIKAAELDVKWNENNGTPTYISSLKSGDYSSVVKCIYTDENGNEVTQAYMEVGKTYKATLTLLDNENFVWKDGAKLEYTFSLKTAFNTVEVPKFENVEFDFTGTIIKNYPEGWDDIKGNVTIVSGSFEQTNAGTYEVVVKANESFIWKGEGTENVIVDGDTIKFTFTIKRAVLKGEWQANGKVNFSSTFQGNYDDVVEYEYKDSNGNVVSYDQLVEGETYTVSVKLKAGMENNFDDSQLPAPTTITFKKTDEGSSFPWWIFLIIGLVLLLIIIIIIIIIIIKKRKKDDEYDDYYDDEYYGDEDLSGEGSSDGGYGDYDDYGSDTY